jgi:hypothetical protein
VAKNAVSCERLSEGENKKLIPVVCENCYLYGFKDRMKGQFYAASLFIGKGTDALHYSVRDDI